MADFMISFLICNLWISVIAGIILAVRRFFYRYLTNRAKYRLWFLLLGCCIVPLLPLPAMRLSQLSDLFRLFLSPAAPANPITAEQAALVRASGAAGWLQDFSVTVSAKTPSGIWQALCFVWIAGIGVMAVSMLLPTLRFYRIRQSALPLQNAAVRGVYQHCREEMRVKKELPVYSTAFLTSPVIAGLFRQGIYLPIFVVSDYPADKVRYMLLHELAHYKHKDTFVQMLMKLARMIYWFHPLVCYALSEMHTDREAACDASVLELLCEDAYADYGNTLLDLAQHTSMPCVPFAAGIGGNTKQIKKRVLNIARYRPPTRAQRIQSTLALLGTAAVLSGFLPLLSVHAAGDSRYVWKETGKKIQYIDLSSTFDGYNGSFVLYDTADGTWQIYDKDAALTRTAPASTYKIYSALLGLKTGTITPKQSTIRWNGQAYSFASWNADQDLASALKNSVNWYFQELDARIGIRQIRNHIHEIGYGNERVIGDTDHYWADGGLKISPVEQVELLQKFYNYTLDFAPEHIEAVKQAIRLESNSSGTLYGKTGTIGYGDSRISGWLVGFVEQENRTCFFAANIQDAANADGQTAWQITLDILAKLQIWHG